MAYLAAAALMPAAAYGSFGGGTPCKDFACYFGFFGLLLGVMGGLSISAVIFMLMHIGFCNPGRSKVKQALLGGLFGMLAFEASAAVASVVATLDATPPSSRKVYAGFLVAYGVLASLSVLYVRSRPHST